MIFNFPPQQDIILEDSRVLLRPLQITDAQYLIPYAINEPDTWKYSLANAAGEQGMLKYIADAIAAKNTGKEYPFIVFDKQTNTYAGCTRFYDIQPQNATLQLGYTWYGNKFRGTGLNKHCKYLLLCFAFESLNIARVEFRADAGNARSIAAMKGIGCQVEGILRSHAIKADGTRRDSIILSILLEDWFTEVKQKLTLQL